MSAKKGNMLDFPGLQVNAKIYESIRSIVYRANQSQNDRHLQIIDFGSSTALTEAAAGSEIRNLSGTLTDMSPEQTGRMNRPVDWRTENFLCPNLTKWFIIDRRDLFADPSQ